MSRKPWLRSKTGPHSFTHQSFLNYGTDIFAEYKSINPRNDYILQKKWTEFEAGLQESNYIVLYDEWSKYLLSLFFQHLNKKNKPDIFHGLWKKKITFLNDQCIFNDTMSTVPTLDDPVGKEAQPEIRQAVCCLT
jgi:hypothetical protein